MARVVRELEIPPEDAEDLVQDTLVALVFKWRSIRDPEAWLLATLRNRCTIYWRRQRESLLDAVDGKILEQMAGVGEPPQRQSELRHDLLVAISRLPRDFQDVLRLRYGLGCESHEVAERLGYESAGMRSLTNRCLTSLSRELYAVGVRPDNAHR